jgi:subtilisin family serine protease
MPKKLVTIVLLTLVLTLPGSVYSKDFGKPGYVPGEILVKFRSGVSKSSRNTAHSAHGSELVRRFKRFQIDHVKIPDGESVEEAIAAYGLQADVEYAEPNYYRHATATPNDPSFGNLWGLDKIQCPAAWDTQTGNPNVVVAVVDSGAALDHEDLLDNIWQNTVEVLGDNGVDDDGNGKIDDYYGWDFIGWIPGTYDPPQYEPEGDNDPDDDHYRSHGTHVSGTIGAVGGNAIGISGVNWQASVMVLKILDENGNGYVSNEIEAIEYAIENGAQIINASFSGEGSSTSEYNALWQAGNAGILVVAAAGNDGRNHDFMPVYPSGYDLPNIISVGATDPNDVLASFSNYGAMSVDVAAPGVGIYSTEAGDTYRYLSGTSMATPHVSGLAALIWAENPGITYIEVKDRILNGVDVIQGLMGNVLMAGRINANKSINPLAKAPDAPGGLEVEAVSAAQIDLSWIDNASDESGFKIERATLSEGPYHHIMTVGPNAESYNDVGLSELTTYYYKVRAFNSAGDSVYSNEGSATTYLAEPDNLTATPVSSSQIDLGWTDNSELEIGYRIERKLGSGGTYSEIATVGTNVTTFSNTGLEASTTYYYRVKPFGGSDNSEYSNEAHATTSAVSASSGGGGGIVSSDSGNDVDIQPTGDSGGGGGCFVDSVFGGI